MVVIRSIADPPLDENSPDNVFALLHYLNREQYGDRPLVYGQYYNAPALDSKDRTSYIPKDGKYKSAYLGTDYTFDERFCTFFPRMYSPSKDHIQEYESCYARTSHSATPALDKNILTEAIPPYEPDKPS